ncbi:alpha/beta hydrolase [Okibacterium endophyticum]
MTQEGQSGSKQRIVFVHGGWHGGWSWGEVPTILIGRGFDVTVVDQLPTTAGEADAGIPTDAELLTRILDELAGPVVLVAHSYGGMVASEIAGHPAVAHVVYVAAFLPEAGAVLGQLLGELPPWIVFDESGSFCSVEREAALQIMAADAPNPEASQAHVDRMVPHSVRVFGQPSTTAGWGSTPISYVQTLNDQVIPPTLQSQMATRAGATIVPIESGHFPMASVPDLVADHIAAAAGAFRAS